MSVSITTSSVADLSRMGWQFARYLDRSGGRPATYAGAGPASKQNFYNAVVDQIVIDQAGTADTTNVPAALDLATPEAAITAIAAL